jgi:hypothetical protein
MSAISVYAPSSARRRAFAYCSRVASVNTSNPGMPRFCSSSTKPRRRRPSMSAAFWLRNDPPPNARNRERTAASILATRRPPGFVSRGGRCPDSRPTPNRASPGTLPDWSDERLWAEPEDLHRTAPRTRSGRSNWREKSSTRRQNSFSSHLSNQSHRSSSPRWPR